MDDLLTDFLTETSEALAELDMALVRLERTPEDGETLSQIFRLVHTIKGTCGFIGLPRLERVAHAGENVLVKVRDKLLHATPDIVTTILSALDRIRHIISTLAAEGKEPAGDDSVLIDCLNAIADGRGPVTPPIIRPPEIRQADIQPVAHPSAPLDLPDHDGPPEVAPMLASADVPSSGRADGISAADAVASQTIRVGVDILERLMTMVSELVLTRNQLLQLARSKEGKSGEMGDFSVPLQRLSHITSDLQEGVMKTRMQPVGSAWNKMPRLVRDLARDLDKKIELQMHGADTELDRQVLELIKDPLTHMVRNSGDHGLETPAERRAAGKHESGRITLKAYHEGGHIIIEIADDGRGLPVDRIRSKILAKGLATAVELAAMNETQIQRFIFRAGFSTASAVTAVSGRGVGMDVVKTNIEKIGGTVDLSSVAGKGTTFTVKIPLTLAIVSALIVAAGGERFAIPQISVVELVRNQEGVKGGDSVIEHIDGTPVLRLRERLLPLVNLKQLLRLDEPTAAQPGAHAAVCDAPDDSQYIVVAQVASTMFGIIVDRVFDTEEIVVKPVAPILRHMTMFSGNTILGDGSVIMILDPNGLARATGIAGGGDARIRHDPPEESTLVHSAEKVAMLLFRACGSAPLAVPLALVARLENIPRDQIETSSGAPVTQYRGRLMPLVALSGSFDHGRPHQPVLVFNDLEDDGSAGRCMGLVVDEIVDVVEDALNIQLGGSRPGVLGTAIVAGRATDIIDTGHWLTQAFPNWFQRSSRATARKPRVLVVEDSDFFRQLLIPTLSAAGYAARAVHSAGSALQLRDAGAEFDAIISDIEMPDMNGIEFIHAVREQGSWQNLPVIALSGRARPQDIEAARSAGFTDFVEKFEQDSLLASLRQCLAEKIAASADLTARAA